LWVLRTACEQLHAWQSAGSGKLGIAVNLSPRQFQQPDLAERAREIAAAARVDPRLVELEITESMLMNDPEHAAATLAKQKASGFKLSVDDFGTGYSSLAYLKAFPLDTLKIDRAFVNDIATDPDDAAIALAIINLAHNLRLNVVAEGVENEPQLNFLMRHGCDQLQGYLFSPPVEAEGMTRMLAANRKLEMHTRHLQSKPTLLLLDDNKDDLILFQHAVADEGYEILTARTATQAFELLAENDVHVVVSDHHMPGMSGVEFLSRVKQIYPHITRVMVTGTSDPNDISEAINGAAIHKFLLKDWGAEQVRSTMRQALLHADLESAPAGGKTSGGP
jgi:EAL domain-containing protein (putative c-di-GMP-specific phosphodiesterase class I)/CheY-like chemotaxis protein